jgi:hypothetical protein
VTLLAPPSRVRVVPGSIPGLAVLFSSYTISLGCRHVHGEGWLEDLAVFRALEAEADINIFTLPLGISTRYAYISWPEGTVINSFFTFSLGVMEHNQALVQ